MVIVLLSAFFYLIPFWYSPVWPLIFLFPALLIIAHVHRKISPLAALLWSALISVGHLLPIAHALYSMSCGAALFKIIPGALLIGYVIICSFIWLLVTSKFNNTALWIGALWFFLLCMDRAILLPFSGNLEGSIFMNPLLILPPSLLTLLPKLGTEILLGIFCITSSSIGLWFCNKISLRWLIIAMMPWIISIGLVEKSQTPFAHEQIGYLPIMVSKESDCSALFAMLLPQIQSSHPQLTTIIMPESACPHIPSITSDINLIIGSFQNHSDSRSNIACWISNGKPHIFRKTHTMTFGETLPSWLNIPFFQQLIFSTTLPILKSDNNHPQWKLGNLTVVPYICSELFLSNHPHDESDHPIVALCNDWWFKMPHFKKLMGYAARLRAIQWARPIVYVSYSQGLFFDQFGNSFSIERL
jgi:hypothetical protein